MGLADRVQSPGQAICVVSVAAMALALLNWGLGLIGGALLARYVGASARRRGVQVHFPLLAAAGYSGLLVWHAGLSGSAPLKVTLLADVREVLGSDMAARVGAIGLERTILSPSNLLVLTLLLVVVPWMLTRLHPDREIVPYGRIQDEAPSSQAGATPVSPSSAERLLVYSIAAVGIVTLIHVVSERGLDRLDPNLLNFAFLFIGLAAHGSYASYARAAQQAATGCAGIILQFPLYAGVMGLLTNSGLLAELATRLSSLGSTFLPAGGFYLAGLVNLFVPSGGGQWAVQGPLFIEAALNTGIAPERMVLALAYGDQWTNMLQPFWALPLLAVTGLSAREMMGYTGVLLIVSQLIFVLGLYVGW
jgi:short-chain fatty acids transporter